MGRVAVGKLFEGRTRLRARGQRNTRFAQQVAARWDAEVVGHLVHVGHGRANGFRPAGNNGVVVAAERVADAAEAVSLIPGVRLLALRRAGLHGGLLFETGNAGLLLGRQLLTRRQRLSGLNVFVSQPFKDARTGSTNRVAVQVEAGWQRGTRRDGWQRGVVGRIAFGQRRQPFRFGRHYRVGYNTRRSVSRR